MQKFYIFFKSLIFLLIKIFYKIFFCQWKNFYIIYCNSKWLKNWHLILLNFILLFDNFRVILIFFWLNRAFLFFFAAPMLSLLNIWIFFDKFYIMGSTLNGTFCTYILWHLLKYFIWSFGFFIFKSFFINFKKFQIFLMFFLGPTRIFYFNSFALRFCAYIYL